MADFTRLWLVKRAFAVNDSHKVGSHNDEILAVTLSCVAGSGEGLDIDSNREKRTAYSSFTSFNFLTADLMEAAAVVV